MEKYSNFQKIPFIEKPSSLSFELPAGLIPHHVMIKDPSETQADLEYYRNFCKRTYDKFIMTYETGPENNNLHFHIMGWNTETKNKFSNFKRGDAKLRKATMNQETHQHELKLCLEEWGLSGLHFQIYYLLKEQTGDDLFYTNLDHLPTCVNGHSVVLQSLPAKIQLKIKNKGKKSKIYNQNFLSLLIENYPLETINQKYWNDENRDPRAVQLAIFDYTLSYCINWNLTKPNAKSLAIKIFKDFCWTLWMQYYMQSSKQDRDELLESVFPNTAF